LAPPPSLPSRPPRLHGPLGASSTYGPSCSTFTSASTFTTSAPPPRYLDLGASTLAPLPRCLRLGASTLVPRPWCLDFGASTVLPPRPRVCDFRLPPTRRLHLGLRSASPSTSACLRLDPCSVASGHLRYRWPPTTTATRRSTCTLRICCTDPTPFSSAGARRSAQEERFCVPSAVRASCTRTGGAQVTLASISCHRPSRILYLHLLYVSSTTSLPLAYLPP